jgi:glycosyltransferase involved in cell wall biosynthesis
MKFVFASYIKSPAFNRPEDWISRIRAYLGVLESLAKQHSVVSIEQINYTGDYAQNKVQYKFVDFGKRKLFFPWRLHSIIKKESPDIIVIHGMGFPLQVIQLRLRMGTAVKIIVQNHESQPPGGYKKILQQLADKCINAYFFTAKDMSEKWVHEGIIKNEKKIHEVMVGSSVFYPVDKKIARIKNDITGHPVFLWAGRLDDNKDPLTVVKAFLRFSIFQPEARLYMIYQTLELLTQVKEFIKESKAVVLVGKVLHADMLYWFNSADFFISSSHFEVFGAAVSEAMSCGCIPLITDIPSFRKITNNGTCGLLYAPGDEEALLAKLHQVMHISMEEAQKKVITHFQQQLSFDAIAQRIQEVVSSL